MASWNKCVSTISRQCKTRAGDWGLNINYKGLVNWIELLHACSTIYSISNRDHGILLCLRRLTIYIKFQRLGSTLQKLRSRIWPFLDTPQKLHSSLQMYRSRLYLVILEPKHQNLLYEHWLIDYLMSFRQCLIASRIRKISHIFTSVFSSR